MDLLRQARRSISSSENQNLQQAHLQSLVSKWGLDELFRWKLSREFASKYPSIDCTGGKRSKLDGVLKELILVLVTAQYPMFASQTISNIQT
jgi:hypothetical protein